MVLGLGMFVISLRQFPGDLPLARSVVLTASILFQLLLAFSTRTKKSVFTEWPWSNPWLLGAVSLSILAQAALLLTPLSKLFGVKAIPMNLCWELLIAALSMFAIFELLKMAKNAYVEVTQRAV